MLTHGHLDHTASALWARERYNAEIYAHRDDVFLLHSLPEQIAYYRIRLEADSIEPDVFIGEGPLPDFCGEPLSVVHTPGHTPGSVLFYAPQSGLAFTGDTLFAGSVGRTDLAGGDVYRLMESLRKIAQTLPPETVLLPGHGPHTTLESELRTNLYLHHAMQG